MLTSWRFSGLVSQTLGSLCPRCRCFLAYLYSPDFLPSLGFLCLPFAFCVWGVVPLPKNGNRHCLTGQCFCKLWLSFFNIDLLNLASCPWECEYWLGCGCGTGNTAKAVPLKMSKTRLQWVISEWCEIIVKLAAKSTIPQGTLKSLLWGGFARWREFTH